MKKDFLSLEKMDKKTNFLLLKDYSFYDNDKSLKLYENVGMLFIYDTPFLIFVKEYDKEPEIFADMSALSYNIRTYKNYFKKIQTEVENLLYRKKYNERESLFALEYPLEIYNNKKIKQTSFEENEKTKNLIKNIKLSILDNTNNFKRIKVNDLDIFASYSTMIAFSFNKNYFLTKNEWGPTTGGHLNEIAYKYWKINRKKHEKKFNDFKELLNSVYYFRFIEMPFLKLKNEMSKQDKTPEVVKKLYKDIDLILKAHINNENNEYLKILKNNLEIIKNKTEKGVDFD